MIEFKILHPAADEDTLGLIPFFFSLDDPRPAKEQINENYEHGGGWKPRVGANWKALPDGRIQYPGDEALPLVAEAKLRNETIRFYPGAWVSIVQHDGSFEVDRID